MNILQALTNKKTTEAELAGAAGISTDRLYNCQTGMIELLAPERERIEDVLGVTLDWPQMSMWKKIVSPGFNVAMKRHGCTQPLLANAANINQSRVSLILNELAQPTEHEVKRIEKCLGKINWQGKDLKTNDAQKETPLKSPAYPKDTGHNNSQDDTGNSPDKDDINQMPSMKFDNKE